MAKRRGYPWSILEIDATRDESVIKKAYASKLRVTRPEDDQDAFQALIEARDAAIFWCSSRVPNNRQNGANTKTSRSGTAKNIKRLGKPVTESDDAPMNGNADHLLAKRDATLERCEEVVCDLREVLSPTQGAPSQVKAELAIEKLKHFPIDMRAEIEPELLTIVADSIQGVLHSGYNVDDPGRRRFHLKKTVILELDEEFGWSSNDRYLDFLHSSSNGMLADQLQLLRNPKGPLQNSGRPAELPWWKKGVGVMVLIWIGIQVLSKILGYR